MLNRILTGRMPGKFALMESVFEADQKIIVSYPITCCDSQINQDSITQ